MTNKLTIGIDLGGTNIKSGLVNSAGEIIFDSKEPTNGLNGPAALLDQLAKISRALLKKTPTGQSVEYIGVGTLGIVDPIEGKVLAGAHNLPGWAGTKVAEELSRRLGLPVFVENDVNAMALAELEFGAGRGANSLICVTVGTGIGGALVIDGKLLRGERYSAGEIGQIPVDIAVDMHSGSGEHVSVKSLEELTSAEALVSAVRRRLSARMTDCLREILGEQEINSLRPDQVLEGFKRGDPIALEEVTRVGKLLGRALAGMINVWNPERVILGGGIVEGLPKMVSIVSGEAKIHIVESAAERVEIIAAALKNRAGLIGAARLGCQRQRKEKG